MAVKLYKTTIYSKKQTLQKFKEFLKTKMQNQEQTTKKPIGKKKFIILGALLMAMILSIGLTWTFWSAGIGGAGDDTGINIGVGTADNTLTQISLTPAGSGQGTLIPGAIPLRDGDTHAVEFTVNVVWNAQAGQQNPHALTGVEGTLAVSLVSIIADGQYNLTNATGFENRNTDPTASQRYYTDAPLFVVEFIDTHTIIGNDSAGVTVNFRVTMNIPYNQAMYNQVAGNDIVLTFNFNVTPPSELAA